MESIWWKTTEPAAARETLRGDYRADVAVIGAGLAGILTAYQLQQKGARVVVIDRGRIGGGATGRTTGKITSQHRLIYDKLLRGLGEEKASLYAQANERAVRQYAALVEEKGIDCAFSRRPACVYALHDSTSLEKEAEAARRLGIPARMDERTELPFPVAGALWFPDQAQFHPLKFLNALAEELTVFEHTPALAVEGRTVRIPRGRIRAKAVVVATHYPFINAPGYYFMRMHQERSYVLALQGAPAIEGMYIDAAANGLSFREAEGLLLLGGGSHRTGKNPAGGQYEQLRRAAAKLYPQASVQARWSNQDCMTADGAPYIGPYSSSTPRLFVATGFGKWGMTGSMVAATLLSDRIAGEANSCAPAFSPSRFPVKAASKNLAADGSEAVAGLSKQVFHRPAKTLDSLENGQGGIVNYNGKKCGAYKTEEGRVYLVSTRCPHLGCELQWNPEEKTWDCPCHGSRFDYKGRLIEGPAQHCAHSR